MSDAPYPEFEYRLVVLERHLDTFGHVNNATYLALFEEARWQVITERGFGLEQIQASKQGPVILEVSLRFVRELKLREHIVIRSQTLSYEGRVASMRQWITNERGETCCEALFKFGLFDLATRKLMAPTEAWMRAIGKP